MSKNSAAYPEQNRLPKSANNPSVKPAI